MHSEWEVVCEKTPVKLRSSYWCNGRLLGNLMAPNLKRFRCSADLVINNLLCWYKDSLFFEDSAKSCSSNQTSGDTEDNEVTDYKQWHDLIIYVCLIFQVELIWKRIQVLEFEHRSLYRKIDAIEKKIADYNKVNAMRPRSSHLVI